MIGSSVNPRPKWGYKKKWPVTKWTTQLLSLGTLLHWTDYIFFEDQGHNWPSKNGLSKILALQFVKSKKEKSINFLFINKKKSGKNYGWIWFQFNQLKINYLKNWYLFCTLGRDTNNDFCFKNISCLYFSAEVLKLISTTLRT